MDNKILKTDVEKIESEQKKESSYSVIFQPFLDEFLKNEYLFTEPDQKWKTIRDIIYSGSLEGFMREQALIKSPYFETMPTTKEKKLQLVDVEAIYPNYEEIKALFAEIEKLPTKNRSKINNFFLDKAGALQLTDSFKLKIKDSYTIYADDPKQYEAFIKAKETLNALIDLQENFGINFFSQNLIQRTGIGTLKGATINAGGVKYVVSQFMRSR